MKSYSEIAALKSAARDMGIPVSRLMRDMGSMKLAALEIPELAEDAKAVNRRADKVAAKFGTFGYSKAENEWARISRDAMRNDKAAIAARKICRAIPVEKAAIVTTRRGYDVVTISRVERAANPEPIRRKLEKAIEAEKAAMLYRQTVEEKADKKTYLDNYKPKAVRRDLQRAGHVADRHHAIVRKLRRKLAAVASQRVANNLTVIRVGEIPLSLNPQVMANRVAKLAMDIPARKDVNPFRELPHISGNMAESDRLRKMRVNGNPELELLAKEEEQELLELFENIAAHRAARESATKAAIAKAEAEAEAEKAEAKKLKQENTRKAYNARRAAAAKIRREYAKLHAAKKMRGK